MSARSCKKGEVRHASYLTLLPSYAGNTNKQIAHVISNMCLVFTFHLLGKLIVDTFSFTTTTRGKNAGDKKKCVIWQHKYVLLYM